jgi:hypothetical protein
MTTRIPSKAALDCCTRLGHLMASVPSPYPDRAVYDQALQTVKAQITGEGGTFRDNWNGARVSLHGFTASSTTGLPGALQNWRTQVTLKAASASMAAGAALS